MNPLDLNNNLGFEFTAMACPCELRIAGLSESASEVAAHAAIAEVRRIEHKYSRYRDDSIVSRINAAAGNGRWIELDDETAQLLSFAKALHQQSDGLFDITSGVLRKAWDFKSQRIPADNEIKCILPLVNFDLCSIIDGKVMLTIGSMQIDLGGFGKEYAADRAGLVLRQHGVTHGFVNLGGDIHVIGPLPDATPWSIGIAHPRKDNALIGHVMLTQGAVTTSGDSERFFERDGKRYCHIISPKTGWPVSGWQSISVIASSAIMAGALTTIAMLKESRALAFLDSYQLPYFAVNSEGVIFTQTGKPSAQSASTHGQGRFVPT